MNITNNDITIAELNKIFKDMDDNNKEGAMYSTKDWVDLLIQVEDEGEGEGHQG